MIVLNAKIGFVLNVQTTAEGFNEMEKGNKLIYKSSKIRNCSRLLRCGPPCLSEKTPGGGEQRASHMLHPAASVIRCLINTGKHLALGNAQSRVLREHSRGHSHCTDPPACVHTDLKPLIVALTSSLRRKTGIKHSVVHWSWGQKTSSRYRGQDSVSVLAWALC